MKKRRYFNYKILNLLSRWNLKRKRGERKRESEWERNLRLMVCICVCYICGMKVVERVLRFYV